MGYWRFGEPSGTALLDSSGHNNNGTYLGGVALGALGIPGAIPNTAATYDGVNDTGRVPDANSLDVGNSFSIEGWIKRSSTTKTHELFNKGANGFQLVVMNAASRIACCCAGPVSRRSPSRPCRCSPTVAITTSSRR